MTFKIWTVFFFLFFVNGLYSQSESFFFFRKTISSDIKIADSLKEEFMYAKGLSSTTNQPPTTFFFPTNPYSKGLFDEKGISYLPNNKVGFLYDNQKLFGNIDLTSYTNQNLNFYSIRTFREIQKYGFSFYDKREQVTFQLLLRQYQMIKNYNGNSYLDDINLFYGEDRFSGIVPGFIVDWRMSKNSYLRYKIERINYLKGRKEFIQKDAFLQEIGYHRGDSKIFGSIEKILLVFRLGSNLELFFAPYSREHLKERSSMYPFFTLDISGENAVLKSFVYNQKFNQKVNGFYFYLQILF